MLLKQPPQKLQIISDDNEIEFVRIIKTKTENIFEYRYTKSRVNLKNLTFSENVLKKYLTNKTFIEL